MFNTVSCLNERQEQDCWLEGPGVAEGVCALAGLLPRFQLPLLRRRRRSHLVPGDDRVETLVSSPGLRCLCLTAVPCVWLRPSLP